MSRHSLKFAVSLALLGNFVPVANPEAAAQPAHRKVERTETSAAVEAARVLSHLSVVVLDRIEDARLRDVATRIVGALKRLARATDPSQEAVMLAHLSHVNRDAKAALGGSGLTIAKCEHQLDTCLNGWRCDMLYSDCITMVIWEHTQPYP